MRVPLLLLGVLSSSGLVACVGAPGQDPPAPESVGTTSSAATAIVSVERTSGPGDSVRGDAVLARFVRVKQGSVDDSALRIAGVASDVPYPGMCFTPGENTPSTQAAHNVELLNAGSVTLTQADAPAYNVVMLPRVMPDPANIISGFVYSTRSADAYASGSRITVKSSGGLDLADGFSVSTLTPREITDVRVAAVAAGLDVSWEIEAESTDLVYVDLLSPAPRVQLRCTAIDAGHFVVPSNVDEGQIAVHRVHKESFKAKGIEPGEVRFDIAKIVTFKR